VLPPIATAKMGTNRGVSRARNNAVDSHGVEEANPRRRGPTKQPNACFWRGTQAQASRKEVLDYCKTKPEFLLKEAGAQQVWVTRFMKRYKIGAYDKALVHLREDNGRMSHSSSSPVEATTSAAPTPVVTAASDDDNHHETVISIDGVEQTTYGDAGGDGSASSGDSDAVTNTDAIARRTRT
jgi:hypothetical protein